LTKSTSGHSTEQYISRRLSHTEVLFWANTMWEDQKQAAESIASRATRLICKAYERNPAFFESKSKKWILGGLFYLLARGHGQPKTQKQIAKTLDTNEMTIRASYREWLRIFPELYTKPTKTQSTTLQRINKLT